MNSCRQKQKQQRYKNIEYKEYFQSELLDSKHIFKIFPISKYLKTAKDESLDAWGFEIYAAVSNFFMFGKLSDPELGRTILDKMESLENTP